jgi:hypothetical protein
MEVDSVAVLQSLDEFDRRMGRAGAQVAAYVTALEVALKTCYQRAPHVQGSRAAVITMAPGQRHRIWLVSLSGALDDREQAFAAEVAPLLPVPDGIQGGILLSVTYRVGGASRSDAQLGLHLPDELTAPMKTAGTPPMETCQLVDMFWSRA